MDARNRGLFEANTRPLTARCWRGRAG